MNRQERRAQARRKGPGMTHADVIARRKIGKETLRMAMEDQAVAMAADRMMNVIYGLLEVDDG